MGVRLAKWQRNAVFEAVRQAGLRPEDFHWGSDDGDDRLTHVASHGYFVFGGTAAHYLVRYAASDAPVADVTKYSWAALTTSLNVWLAAVKADGETPDLWAELTQARDALGPARSGAAGNTPFDAEERAAIRSQLREIHEYVKQSYELSESQVLVLDESVAYLDEAASRLGRIDWRNALVGAMLGAIVTAALPSETIRTFLRLLFEGIGHLFGHGLLAG